MLRGRDRVFLAAVRPGWLVVFCFSTLPRSSMIFSWCRRSYSPRVKSSRRAGVAGGVGEGEVVTAGGVLEGEAILLSVEPGLKYRRRKSSYVNSSTIMYLNFKTMESLSINFLQAYSCVRVTCFLFLAHAIVSSFSAPLFAYAVFLKTVLYAEPSPLHCAHPPAITTNAPSST